MSLLDKLPLDVFLMVTKLLDKFSLFNLLFVCPHQSYLQYQEPSALELYNTHQAALYHAIWTGAFHLVEHFPHLKETLTIIYDMLRIGRVNSRLSSFLRSFATRHLGGRLDPIAIAVDRSSCFPEVCIQIVQILVQFDARQTLLDRYSFNTPFQLALERGNLDMMVLLADQESLNFYDQRYYGYPLDFAIRHVDVRLVKLLLDHKAKCYIERYYHYPTLKRCTRSLNMMRILNLLLIYGVYPMTDGELIRFFRWIFPAIRYLPLRKSPRLGITQKTPEVLTKSALETLLFCMRNDDFDLLKDQWEQYSSRA